VEFLNNIQVEQNRRRAGIAGPQYGIRCLWRRQTGVVELKNCLILGGIKLERCRAGSRALHSGSGERLVEYNVPPRVCAVG